MALVNLPGAKSLYIGPTIMMGDTTAAATNSTLDATNEAVIFIGYVETSDGASHTIDTSGSSSIGWRSGTTTFANVGSSFSVGIAPVDTTNGPVGRAVNSSDVITFDVAAVFTGGGGGVTTAAWQTSVPTTGSKTIANGDLVAVCMQFTTRAGVDSVLVSTTPAVSASYAPQTTTFLGGTYANLAVLPNVIITFSDGAFGWVHMSEIFSTRTTLTFDSNDANSEYGHLYNLPFATKIYGLYTWVDGDNDWTFNLYSDPLGTPVPEKTVSVDSNTRSSTASRRMVVFFSSPYTYVKNTNIAAVLTPTTTSSISTFSKTLASADHRVADQWGAIGYGVRRGGGTGAFANINSSMDQIYAGLIVGAFDDGASAGSLLRHPGMNGGLNA